MSFHVNPDTGRTGKCDAKIQCRFGLSQEEHFETREEAQDAFEKDQGSQIGSSKKKSKIEEKLSGTDMDTSSIPDINGIPFATIWKKKFKKLDDYKSGKIKIGASSPDDLLDEPVNPMRERGSYFESRKDFIEEQGDYFTLNPETEYIVVVSARQGGGNRECYCELDYGESNPQHEEYCLNGNNEEIASHPNFLTDVDDDFDSTYNHFYFDNGITQKDINEVEENKKEALEISSLETLRNKIKKGEMPAWVINAKEEELSAFSTYSQTKQSVENNRDRAVKAQAELRNLNKINENFETKGLTNEDINEFNKLSDSFKYQNQLSVYDKSDVNNYFTKKKEYENISQVKKDAEALEDGSPLKEHLLGDRGTKSYKTTEGKGRGKKRVTKTYKLGSRLGKEEEEAKDLFERSSVRYNNVKEKINKQINERKSTVDEYVENKNSLNKLRNEAWATGWVGDKSKIPAPPEDF